MPRPMKNSGIKWIGDIPADWEVVNIRKLFFFGKGLPITKEDLRESGLPVISYGQIHSKFNSGTTITSELIRFVDDDYLQSYSQSLVKCGDFIFADTSEDLAGCGNCVYVDIDKRIFAGYHTIILRNKTCSQMKYFAFLFQSDAWRKQIRERVTGVKLFSISQKILRATSVIIPPLDEQQRIATFLDDKCARIDSVIEKTRASVEEYKKLKQAIITRAVTKGIRPNRTLKHSGIEWLGDIPADWELVRFCNVLHERNEKNSPVKSTERLSLSIDLGVTLYAEKTTNLDRFKDDFEQYKIAHVGDLVMNSMNMIVGATGMSAYYGCVSPAYYTFYDDTEDHVTAKFCEYIFRSKAMLRVLYSLGKGIYAIVRGDDRVNTCRLKISREDLRNIKIPVPPLDEQKEIAAYLDGKTAAIDSLVAKKNQLVTELESLKKSLIFEYVTGKKEVPT